LAVQRCAFAAPQLPRQTEAALNATLLVRVPGGIGSAVLISPDGFALTAAHVVERNQTMSVVTRNGYTVAAHVVRIDEIQDVALIKVEVAPGAPCLSLINQRTPIGSDVFVLGSPAGEELSFSVAKGIVSGYRDLGGLHFVQLDAAVNPGNSGGPVVNNEGRVIGIASWKISGVSMEGLSFAVPADIAIAALDIQFADTSTADWASASGRRELPQPRVVPTAHSSYDYDPIAAKRRRLRGGFIGSGAVLLGVGTVVIAVTAGYYYTVDSMASDTWRRLQITNTVGWTLGGIGVAALITGLAVPRKPKNSASPQLSVGPATNGLSVRGRF